jgi:hypothetical protein
MRKYILTLGIAGLAAAISSSAMAGGALVAALAPTGNAISCDTATACESNGSGASATLKIKGVNNMSFNLDGLLANQTYTASVASAGCGNEVTSFDTADNGAANVVQPLESVPALDDVVEICRVTEVGLVPILSGQLGRMNGK